MNKNLIAAIMLAVEGTLFFVFVMPQYKTYAGAKESLKSREVLLADTRSAQKRIASLQKDFDEKNTIVQKAIRALPKQRRYDDLTETFQVAASSTGVQLSSLTIGEVQKTTGNYIAFPIKAELRGGYREFLTFLETLERSLRLYDITKVDISQTGATDSFSSSLIINMQITSYSLQ